MYGCDTVYIPYLFLLLLCVDAKALEGKSNEIKPMTSSILQLESCSADSSIVRYRTMCMNKGRGCPGGTFYVCGLDSTETFIIEDCQPDLECRPGTTHQFLVHRTVDKTDKAVVDETVELKCLPCPDGWFEPEFSRSSRSSLLLGCTYKHKPSSNISKNLVLFENGTKSRATIWYCDIENEYYEQDENMFCDDVPTKPCDCVKKSCPEGHLLRPDGRCVRCNTKLDPKNNFRCIHEDSNNLSQPTTAGNLIAKRVFQRSRNDSQYPQKDRLANHSKVDDDRAKGSSNSSNSDKDEGNTVATVLIVGAVVLVLGILLCFCCIGFRRGQPVGQPTTQTVYFVGVRGCVTSMVVKCKNLTRADEITDDTKRRETKAIPNDDDSAADKDNLEDYNRNNVQIADSSGVQFGEQNIQIYTSQTTDNSKTVHNGPVYNNCVFKPCSHTEPNTPPPSYNDLRSKLPEEEASIPKMDTLKFDSDSRYTGQPNSLEMDHQPESEHSDQVDRPLLSNSQTYPKQTDSQTYPKQIY